MKIADLHIEARNGQEPAITHGGPETPQAKPPEHGERGENARKRLADLGRRVTGGIRTARTGAARLVDRAPETMHAARAAAVDLTTNLQKAPDSTLRWLAATSVGVGAGFYLRRSPRLVVAAGILPAVVMGAAIVLRPNTAEPPLDAQAAPTGSGPASDPDLPKGSRLTDGVDLAVGLDGIDE